MSSAAASPAPRPPGRSPQRGVPVVLHEMRPVRATAAHKTDGLAELVCSNSFRSDDRETNAVGLLHEEMRRLGSLVMRAADANQVPAGGALAVDRDGFSAAVTAALDRPSADRDPPRGGRAAAAGLGQRHRRDRPAHLAGARRRDRRAHRRGRARLLRRHRADRASRLASTWRSPGSSRATTRRAPAARAPTTSTARSTARNTRPSSTRWSPATRWPSTNGSRRRPISTAACRSR